MKKGKKPAKVKTANHTFWRTVLPLVAILGVGSLGAYLTFHSQGASVPPTFKLFAPAWRGLGGDANLDNVKHFTQIFGRSRTVVPAAKIADGTKFYKYSLGPYVTIGHVECDLIPSTQPYLVSHPASCEKDTPVLTTGMARGITSNKVVWANGFTNNFLLVPNDIQTINYVKADAATLPGGFDGLLSDSMGVAPLGGNYLNEKPRKPGTTREWYANEWIPAQQQMLQAKKSGLPAGKVLIINGLATGQVYFSGADNASPRAFATMPEVTGVMAERIFRDPNGGAAAWEPNVSVWKQDVDMIADVQSKGKLGYWWTKCWADGDTCRNLPDATNVMTAWRRFSVASFLLGAGSNSYYNYDTDKTDNSPATYLGPGQTEANAAEWFAGDYTKAEAVGAATAAYTNNGGVYTRAFSNGLVVVNPSAGAINLNLGGTTYSDFTGTTRTGTYSVPAHTGNVLVRTSGGGGDVTPPTVSRSTPANGATISGSLTATGTANDNVGVVRVELLIDGAARGSDSSPPGVSITIDSKAISNGTHTLSLKAFDAAGNASQTPNITITISNGVAPPAPTITGFSANPNPVTAGGRTWLSWGTTGTTSCSINPDGVQNTKLFTWQTPVLTTAGTKNYTLNCINSANVHVTRGLSVTIQAPTTPPAKPMLTASKTTIAPGGSTTLNWTSTGATGCTLNPGAINTSGPSGSRVVSPASTTNYTVTCKNSAGSVTSDGLTITVSSTSNPPAAPLIVSFVADPANVANGGQSTLRWSTSNVRAGGCRLAPSPLSSTDPNGTWVTPSLQTSTSYTLTCVNSAGTSTSKSTSVTVDNAPAPNAPEPEDPGSNDDTWDDEYLYYDESGEGIDNGSVDEDLSGLAVLDPSNVTDEEKVDDIDHVEYYIDGKLIQSDDTAPFTLDTKKLKNGTYTITEMTYYIDGSTSEVTRTVDINNTQDAANSSGPNAKTKTTIGVGLSLLLLALAGGAYWYVRRRHLTGFIPFGKLLHRNDTPTNDNVTGTNSASLASSLGSGTLFSPSTPTAVVKSNLPPFGSPSASHVAPPQPAGHFPAASPRAANSPLHVDKPDTLPPLTSPVNLVHPAPQHPTPHPNITFTPTSPHNDTHAKGPTQHVPTPSTSPESTASQKQVIPPPSAVSPAPPSPPQPHLDVPPPSPHDPISPNWG